MSAQRPTRDKKNPTAVPKNLRKWHFLLLGWTLILLSMYLWYWNWRGLGIPETLQPEHFTTILSFLVGLFVLGVFVYRLTRQQVLIMLVGMVVANLLAALGTLWIFRSYPAVFNLLRPSDLAANDQAYVANWRTFFLTPALYLIHGGLLLIWAESLVMFFIRKPGDSPD